MKKARPIPFNWIFPALIAGVLALGLFASCSLGLEPAERNAGSGTVALSLATLPGYGAQSSRTDSSGRAVAQGGGYLYIRPLGGPAGTGAKRYYGPYPIRANSSGYDLFKTTDIPGGSYDGLAVLFAASPIDSVPVTLPSGATTLGAVFSLPDAEFRAAVTSPLPTSPEGLTALDVALNDSASFAITGATTIRPNSITNLSVTLVPATGKVFSAIEGGGVAYDLNETHRAFIRVTGLRSLFGTMSAGTSSLGIAVQNPVRASATLSAFAAYRADGSLIAGSVATGITLASEQTTHATAAWDGSDVCYLYAEFAGTALNFNFEAISGGTTASLSVSFTGNSNHANHRAFFAVYDSSSVTYDEEDLEYDPTGDPIALGMAMLDGSGSGTGTACVPGTATPYSFTAGTYYVAGFIDRNNNYTDISGPQDVGLQNDIMPHFDDYIPAKHAEPVSVSATGGTFNYNANTFIMCGDHVYFVSADGAGDGKRRSKAMAFDTAWSYISDGPVGTYHVYLTTDVSRSSGITVRGDCVIGIFSADAGQRSITLTGGATVQVDGGGTLYLENAGIDGNDDNRGENALVQVSGTLVTDTGSFLRDSHNLDGFGGAVQVVDGGSFELRGGTISNCSAVYGGAIHAEASDAHASVSMLGGTIDNCHSDAGGAIYIGNRSSLTLQGGTISNCKANSGGAVYLFNTTATFTFSGGTIQSCEATNGGYDGGGGVSLDSGANMTLNGGKISGCKALSPQGAGGGILLTSSSTLTILSGSVTLCNADSYGDGIAYYTIDQIYDPNGVINSVVSGNIGQNIQQIPN